MRKLGGLVVATALLALAGCGSLPSPSGSDGPQATTPKAAKPPLAQRRGGGYYLDDGPGDNPPADLDAIPDAQPRVEPLHRYANNPYSALGRDYVPMRELKAYKAKGVASWYGRRFHGQPTSSGEPYDMYAMTAAHPTLPIPSYARVTNRANGRSVVVRVNDRGPFLHDRLIDLSYAAAYRLGYAAAGSAPVEVELLLPDLMEVATRSRRNEPVAVLPALPAAVSVPAEDTVAARDSDAPQPLATVTEGRGIFLQLGAFTARDNAESLRAHLATQLSEAGETLHLHAKDGVFRLHMGPYRDAKEAARAAQSLRERLAIDSIVIRR